MGINHDTVLLIIPMVNNIITIWLFNIVMEKPLQMRFLAENHL